MRSSNSSLAHVSDCPAPPRQRREQPRILHLRDGGSPARRAAEAFVTEVFANHYGARVPGFAPDLLAIEQAQRLVAVAGWRSAAGGPLYLEHYLDQPVEVLISRLAGRPVPRGQIVEACNLAARPGHGVAMIRAMAEQLDREGHEWVVFTATRELVRIFARLGLPPLGLAPAKAGRVGGEAAAWGRYYETAPVVVAGRIRLALGAADHA